MENADADMIAELEDRRGWPAAPQSLRLYSDRLEQVRGGAVAARIPLQRVSRVRLAVEAAGREAQVVCRVTGPSGEIAAGSLRALGPGRWENNAQAFRAFVIALHEALEKRAGGVEFLEGPSLALRLALSALGAAMALAGGAVFIWLFAVRENALLSFVAAPFAIFGGYAAWIFRPARPKRYDPAAMIETLKAQARAATPSSG